MHDPGDVIGKVSRWAAEQGDVQAVALVGSHARGAPTPDSDIDLILVVGDVDRRLSDHSWASDFGEVDDVQQENWGIVRSLRVEYRDGPEVEFGLTTVEWTTTPLDKGTAAIVTDGLRVLFDPHGLLAEADKAAKAHGQSTGDGSGSL